MWGKENRITPKTLRKLGICVAEQLGVSREDVERIGGWSVNSDVLNHYFKRKGVEIQTKENNKLLKEKHQSVYAELDKLKIESEKKDNALVGMQEQVETMQNQLELLIKQQKDLKPEENEAPLKAIFEAA